MQDTSYSSKWNIRNKKWAIGLVCVLLAACILALEIYTWHGKQNQSDDATKESDWIIVSWQGEKYKGSYDGKRKKDKPSGKGTFVSVDGELRYEGEWQDGKFHGEGMISYDDESYEKGTYSGGKRSGLITEYISDNEYATVHYKKNVPYGKKVYYKNGKKTDYEFIIDESSNKDIETEAIELTTDVVKNKQYKDQYVYIEGKVVFAGESDTKEYFRIQTDTVGMVIGCYMNTLGSDTKQVYLPTMHNGDKVRIYGRYKDIGKNYVIADREGYGFDYIEIEPLYGYLVEVKEELSDFEKYENRLLYPYGDYQEKVEQTFLVQDVFRKGDKLYIRAVPKEKERESEIYVLVYKEKEEKIILEGDMIKVVGYYDGQYKEFSLKNSDYIYILQDSEDSDTEIRTYLYDFYPAIHVSSVE